MGSGVIVTRSRIMNRQINQHKQRMGELEVSAQSRPREGSRRLGENDMWDVSRGRVLCIGVQNHLEETTKTSNNLRALPRKAKYSSRTRKTPVWLLYVCLLAQIARHVRAQIGTTFCACTPSVYTMTLNFALTCAENTLTLATPGVLDVSCSINPALMGDPMEAYAFQVQVLELDQNQIVLSQETFTDEIQNGGTFVYESAINDPNAQTDKVPGSIEIGIMAQDMTQTRLFMMWTIQFSNSCQVYPVIAQDSQIGWTVMTSLKPPPPAFCPLAEGETAPPTAAPGTGPPGPPTTAPPRPPTSPPGPGPSSPTEKPKSSKGPIPTPTDSPKPPTQKPATPKPAPCQPPVDDCPPPCHKHYRDIKGSSKSKKSKYYGNYLFGAVFDAEYECHCPKSYKGPPKGSKGSSKTSKSSKSSKSYGKGYYPPLHPPCSEPQHPPTVPQLPPDHPPIKATPRPTTRSQRGSIKSADSQRSKPWTPWHPPQYPGGGATSPGWPGESHSTIRTRPPAPVNPGSNPGGSSGAGAGSMMDDSLTASTSNSNTPPGPSSTGGTGGDTSGGSSGGSGGSGGTGIGSSNWYRPPQTQEESQQEDSDTPEEVTIMGTGSQRAAILSGIVIGGSMLLLLLIGLITRSRNAKERSCGKDGMSAKTAATSTTGRSGHATVQESVLPIQHQYHDSTDADESTSSVQENFVASAPPPMGVMMSQQQGQPEPLQQYQQTYQDHPQQQPPSYRDHPQSFLDQNPSLQNSNMAVAESGEEYDDDDDEEYIEVTEDEGDEEECSVLS